MAITRKKQDALNALANAESRLAEYWGVLSITPFHMNERTTIAHINHAADVRLAKVGLPIPSASERQMAYITKLLGKDYNARYKARLEGLKINKYQASEVINNLLTTENMIYSTREVSSHQIDMQDVQMNEIIDLIIKTNKL